VSTLLKFSYACKPSSFYFMWSEIFSLIMMDVRKFCLSFLNVWSVWFLVISQELYLKRKWNIFLSCYFSYNLYIFLITAIDFCKVPYFEDLESQENLKVKRSTTSIKTQGDLHPCEVVFSILTDSSINTKLWEWWDKNNGTRFHYHVHLCNW